jgi:membrane protein insertase Oxa1/YidC/SpoIIIJ
MTCCHALCMQVESALQVQKLKPTIDAIKRQYGEDKKAIQRETSALYEASGVNPTAGQGVPFIAQPICTASVPRHSHLA